MLNGRLVHLPQLATLPSCVRLMAALVSTGAYEACPSVHCHKAKSFCNGVAGVRRFVATNRLIAWHGLSLKPRNPSAEQLFFDVPGVAAHVRACNEQRIGSLNTTWTYIRDTPSSIEMLDDFYEEASSLAEPLPRVKAGQAGDKSASGEKSDEPAIPQRRSVLNKRIYMIWKFPHYCTAYHQDTHVPPHFTLYNQCSGRSLFHFLPVLVGKSRCVHRRLRLLLLLLLLVTTRVSCLSRTLRDPHRIDQRGCGCERDIESPESKSLRAMHGSEGLKDTLLCAWCRRSCRAL